MTPPKLLLSALLTSALILCLINWPGITLAAFLVVACACTLIAGKWLNDCRIEAAEFNEGHDL